MPSTTKEKLAGEKELADLTFPETLKTQFLALREQLRGCLMYNVSLIVDGIGDPNNTEALLSAYSTDDTSELEDRYITEELITQFELAVAAHRSFDKLDIMNDFETMIEMVFDPFELAFRRILPRWCLEKIPAKTLKGAMHVMHGFGINNGHLIGFSLDQASKFKGFPQGLQTAILVEARSLSDLSNLIRSSLMSRGQQIEEILRFFSQRLSH